MFESLPPARSRAVLALPAVAGVALALAVVAEVSTRRNAGFDVSTEPAWVFALCAFVHSVVAAGVIRRGRGTRMGPLLVAASCFWLLATLAHGLIRLPPIGAGLADGAQGWEIVLLWAAKLTSAPASCLSLGVMVCFPDGRLVAGRGRWLAVAGLAALGLSELGIQATRTSLTVTLDPKTDVSAPALGDVLLPGGHLAPSLGTLISLGYLGAALIATTLVVRYRRSSTVERDQLRWMVWGIATVTFLILGFRLLFQPGQLTTFGIALVMNAIVVSVGIALVNPSLVAIEDLLSRTLVYGGLSIAIILVDVAALSGLTALLGSRLAQRQVVLVVLLVSAVVYNPVRAWLWSFVRRLVVGERGDPYDAVAGLASSLEEADEGPGQLEAVATAVATAFGIGYVRVEVDRAGGRRLVASHGREPAQTRAFPVTYRGEPVGRLVLPLRGIRGRLDPRDQRLLGDLVRQAATAARTSSLAEELQENRQRIVVAREDERRRIRNDLHEDLGPTIGGLVHQVEAARLLIAERPEEAKTTIEATSRRLREVVTDVRRVVHDLRPPALDDRGLVGALRQQADLAATDDLAVTVEGARLDGLPAAVEVAAFRMVGNAIRRVGADTAATRCAVRLDRTERQLLVEIETDATLGLGTSEEQAAELGGRTELGASSAGGTVLRAWLPVRAGVPV